MRLTRPTPNPTRLTRLALVSLLAVAASASSACAADDPLAGYEARTHKDAAGGAVMPYRLLKPKDLNPKDKTQQAKYPLILFLHGAGERGGDNAAQLKWGGAILANPVQAK